MSSANLSFFIKDDLIQAKIELKLDSFILLDKNIDIKCPTTGKHLVGLRAEFLEPNSVRFVVSDYNDRTYKVELKTPPKNAGTLHLLPQLLDQRDDIKDYHRYSIKGGMIFPAHRWPNRLIRLVTSNNL